MRFSSHIFHLIIILTVNACSPAERDLAYSQSGSPIRVLFYNVENLFDTVNNPNKNDDEFTPEGARRWTQYRLDNKINNLYRAIAAAGELGVPSIVGLCEVENMTVLDMLTTNTPLRTVEYEIIHRNSPDQRGIDVAFIYNPVVVNVIDTQFVHITFPFNSNLVTRDILYAKTVISKSDTIHFFVNHWPSRYGGEASSKSLRAHTASVLKRLTDSLFSINPASKILIMGDFNDEPFNTSVAEVLEAGSPGDDTILRGLYNLSSQYSDDGTGTYKYQGEWFVYDQFIVSGALLGGGDGIRTSPNHSRVIHADFLLIEDDAWFGRKPFRTYEGYRHSGGYSDHLPIILDLVPE